jgi:hypothetical protein
VASERRPKFILNFERTRRPLFRVNLENVGKLETRPDYGTYLHESENAQLVDVNSVCLLDCMEMQLPP